MFRTSWILLALVACGNNGDEDLTALQARVTAVEEAAASTSAMVSTTQGDVSALSSEVTGLQGDVTAMQGDVTSLVDRVAELEAMVDHTIFLDAGQLALDPGSSVTRPMSTGILWAPSFSGSVGVLMPTPLDYVGGDVLAEVMFFPTTADAGVVEFFARPQSLGVGDTFQDIINVDSTGVTVDGIRKITVQPIVFPEDRMSGPFWRFSLQRGGNGETYAEDVVMMGVRLSYGL